MSKRISLAGKYPHLALIVDDSDFERLSRYKWHYSNGYAKVKRPGGKNVYAHHMVIGRQPGKDIDHINRDRLDVRAANLRFLSHGENAVNGKLRSNNRSGHRGVSWYEPYGKWRVAIHVNGRMKNFGYFASKYAAIAAAEAAYDSLYPGVVA
jgi:hypothetical protein